MSIEEIYQQEDVKNILNDIEIATNKMKSAMDRDLGVNFILIEDSSRFPIPLQKVDLRANIKVILLYDEIRSVLYDDLEKKIKYYLNLQPLSKKPKRIRDLISKRPIEEGEYEIYILDQDDLTLLNDYMAGIIKDFPKSVYFLSGGSARLTIAR